MNTYTRLKSGDWGLRIEGTARPGETVTVTTKAGTDRRETVGRVIWSGNGLTLASIANQGTAPARSTGARSAGARSTGARCADCGRGGRLVADLEDGLLKHYACCDIPPGGY